MPKINEKNSSIKPALCEPGEPTKKNKLSEMVPLIDPKKMREHEQCDKMEPLFDLKKMREDEECDEMVSLFEFDPNETCVLTYNKKEMLKKLTPKEKKMMFPNDVRPSPCKTCERRHDVQCHSITEEQREQINEELWRLRHRTYREKYVAALMIREPAPSDQEKIRYMFKYHLKIGQKVVPVCWSMFHNTLGISSGTSKNWFINANLSEVQENKN